MTKPKRVPVSERALATRINRAIAKNEQKLFKLRGRAAEEFGDYVIVPAPNSNDVMGHGKTGPLSRIEMNGSLDHIGRRLGLLRDWEEVVS